MNNMEGNPPLPPPRRGVGSKSKIGKSTHSSDASLKNNQVGMDLKWLVSIFRKTEKFIDDFSMGFLMNFKLRKDFHVKSGLLVSKLVRTRFHQLCTGITSI